MKLIDITTNKEITHEQATRSIMVKLTQDEAYFENVPDIKKLKIEELKQHLIDTDYQSIKYAEGELTEEEFAPIKAQRKAWREEINELEAEYGDNR